MRSVLVHLAWRNLTRKGRRTLLSVVGIGVAAALSLITIGAGKGKVAMFLRSVAEGGTGHLRLVPEPWVASRDPKWRLHDWQRELSALRGSPRVRVATPRIRAQALLAMGVHVAGVELVGVDPTTEPAADRYVRTMTRGRYLTADDTNAMVLGQATAETLKIDPGDQLVTTVVAADGSMHSDMFTVVGLVDTGSPELDATICQAPLRALAALTGAPGAGEIALLLFDGNRAGAIRDGLESLAAPQDRLLTWDEISPQARFAVRINQQSIWWISIVLLLIAGLGVASAQLTAILERRKELAVLAAIGMGGRRLLSLIMLEGVVLGLAGAAAALVIAVPADYYLATTGLSITGGNPQMRVAGMVMDPVLRADFGMWLLGDALLLSVAAAAAASLYPAWFAMRLEPVTALRVSQ